MRPFEDSIKSKPYIDEQRGGIGLAIRWRLLRAVGAAGIWSASTPRSSTSSRSSPRRRRANPAASLMMYWHGPWCSQPRDNASGFATLATNTGSIRIGRKTARAKTRSDGWRIFSPRCSLIRAGAVYVNDLENEGEARARAAYGDQLPRLAAIKRKYDPTNFFRNNQNIKPAP